MSEKFDNDLENCYHCEGAGRVLYECDEPGHWDQDPDAEVCYHCGSQWEETECPVCRGEGRVCDACKEHPCNC